MINVLQHNSEMLQRKRKQRVAGGFREGLGKWEEATVGDRMKMKPGNIVTVSGLFLDAHF